MEQRTIMFNKCNLLKGTKSESGFPLYQAFYTYMTLQFPGNLQDEYTKSETKLE